MASGGPKVDSVESELRRLRSDLADRDRELRDLLQSRRKYELLIETTATGYVILDEAGTVLDANPEYVRLAGYGRLDEIRGRSVVEWTAPYDRDRNAEEVRKCIEAGQVRNLVIDYCHTDGSAIPVEINATTFRAHGVTTILTVCRDVRERWQTERALQLSKEQYRTTLDAMRDLIHVVDRDLRIVLFNEAGRQWLKRLGVCGEPVGQKVFDLFPFLPDHVRGEYESVLASGRPLLTAERLVVAGKEIVTETRKIPVVEGSRVVRVVTVVRDTTQSVVAQERLRQAEKMEALGQLASGVAHDVNNQLTAVWGCAEMLRQRLREPELSEYATTISRAAARAGDLTKQLLAFARKRTHRSDPVDVHAVIDDVIRLLERTIDRRILLSKRQSARRHVVLGDAVQLQSALLNLAINARDAMPDGGELTFSTDEVQGDANGAAASHGADMLRVNVADTGTGMTDDVKRRLFEPFFTTKAPGVGTGMGLAAVYGTVVSHHGSIQVHSVAGEGSTFSILLPLAPSDLLASRPSEAPSPESQALHILVADDEPDVREVVASLLRQLGHRVTESANGAEAVEHIRSHPGEFGLAMLDVIMPVLGGLDALREIRELAPAMPVILISGNAPEAEMSRALAESQTAFLQKPCGVHELARALRSMTSK